MTMSKIRRNHENSQKNTGNQPNRRRLKRPGTRPASPGAPTRQNYLVFAGLQLMLRIKDLIQLRAKQVGTTRFGLQFGKHGRPSRITEPHTSTATQNRKSLIKTTEDFASFWRKTAETLRFNIHKNTILSIQFNILSVFHGRLSGRRR